jgi:hypothetical protein
MRKLIWMLVAFVFVALLLAPLTTVAAADNNDADLIQLDFEPDPQIIAWHGGKNCPNGPPCRPPDWPGKKGKTSLNRLTLRGNGDTCPHGPPCGPPGWSGKKGNLTRLTVRNGDGNACPNGPPCGPPGWSGPPGWIPGPPGWAGPSGSFGSHSPR